MAVLNNVLEVFSSIGQWIPEALNNMIPIFYTAPTTTDGTGSLTVIGVLAVCGLAISVCMLIFKLVRSFLRFQ